MSQSSVRISPIDATIAPQRADGGEKKKKKVRRQDGVCWWPNRKQLSHATPNFCSPSASRSLESKADHKPYSLIVQSTICGGFFS